MTIRPYQPADRETCLEIFNSNCPDYFDPSEIDGLENWLNGQDTGEITYKTSEADFFYVLEQHGKVVACGGFYIVKDTLRANMVWGMVEKQYHQKGFGKHLLMHRVEQVNTLYPRHTIVLDTSQHTYKFFEQIGFSVVKITLNAYGPGLHRYDMVK